MTEPQTIYEHLLNVAGSKACEEARRWASKFKTAQEVWDNCERADWLFWWAMRLGQRKQGVAAAIEIANTVAHLRRKYAANAAADAAANAAAAYAADAYAADAAANAAAAYAADAYAADAAAYAAANAAAANAAAAYAAYAADAATYAAANAATYAGKKQNLLNLQIAKKHLTCPWHEPIQQEAKIDTL